MSNTSLVITSIADSSHPVLNLFAKEAAAQHINFYLIGDSKSPANFELDNCQFYSLESQKQLAFKIAKDLPEKHYARKNIGYLLAIANGSEVIIETDDDNIPYDNFWNSRLQKQNTKFVNQNCWVNAYKYFTEKTIWPRGFALEHINIDLPNPSDSILIDCPIQQGLADKNPDVDAIYRLTYPLPISFNQSESIALGNQAICPFNSQNTTWFKTAFPLMYLPSYCSFRMTDIWRSFIAQRILWTCNQSVLFHSSTVYQERNAHNLMEDFKDEIPGYTSNLKIMNLLETLPLESGIHNISKNLLTCYKTLIEHNIMDQREMTLLESWLFDIKSIL